MVAGLAQLERILLGLNEYAGRRGEPMRVAIRWEANVSARTRSLPSDERWTAIAVEAAPPDAAGYDFTLTTRTVLPRFHNSADDALAPEKHDCIRDPADIDRAERRLLRRTGKTQDGIIARNFDRHISRWVSRHLLKFPITPTACTLAIFPFAIAAFIAFIYDGWSGIFIGMLLVEIQSLLDGCDGEIARARYLESELGRRLDTLCDIAIEILIALGIGLGLWRHAAATTAGPLFLWEGVSAAALIALREWLLSRQATAEKDEPENALYQRHAHLVRNNGIFGFGQRFSAFLMQLTKRDVGIAVFLLLAAIGQGQWILHILFFVAFCTLAAMGFARYSASSTEA